jgi:hypothetical protein
MMQEVLHMENENKEQGVLTIHSLFFQLEPELEVD